MREFEGFYIQRVADDPSLVSRIQTLIDAVWPKFVTHSDAPKNYALAWDWMGVFRRWPHLQFALLDSDGEMVGAGNALTFVWDGPAEALPDEGWHWVMNQAVLDLEAGRQPNAGSALSVTLAPNQRGRNLSGVMLRAMKLLVQESGARRFFAPVRPTTKARYPITPMEEFITWKNAEGLPLDPWMRVHVRLGAKVIKACNRSQPLAASVAEWEEWLDLPLPASGEYVGPGLLATLHVDCQQDEGVCFEPNVWIEHSLP